MCVYEQLRARKKSIVGQAAAGLYVQTRENVEKTGKKLKYFSRKKRKQKLFILEMRVKKRDEKGEKWKIKP